MRLGAPDHLEDLRRELARMRARMSEVRSELQAQYGEESRLAERAAEVQASLQRLEWQLTQPDLVARARLDGHEDGDHASR